RRIYGGRVLVLHDKLSGLRLGVPEFEARARPVKKRGENEAAEAARRGAPKHEGYEIRPIGVAVFVWAHLNHEIAGLEHRRWCGDRLCVEHEVGLSDGPGRHPSEERSIVRFKFFDHTRLTPPEDSDNRAPRDGRKAPGYRRSA
ncbi:MAG: hypothetical protein GY906_15515, partial [bacterium]|nr:hypothetical protein [bacterium]